MISSLPIFHSLTVIAIVVSFFTIVGWSQQSAAAPIPDSSTGAMAGIDLQRTNRYQTKAVDKVGGLLWKSEKLFGINYAATLTSSFDGSLDSADIGYSDPVFSNGLVYFQLCLGLRQNFVRAIDSKNGSSVWNFTSKDAISDPAIAGDSIYFVTANGKLYSLDAKTGVEKWTFTDKGKHWNVYSSPAVSGGTIYFGSLDGHLYAFNIATREVKWVFKSKGVLSTPAFFGDNIFVGNEKGTLFAVDASTGRSKWEFELKGRPQQPLVAGGNVFVRTDEGILYAISTISGAQKWTTTIGGKYRPVFPISSVQIGTYLAYYDGILFFGGSDKDRDSLFAIDASNGQQKWKFELGGPARTPILADGIVYVGTFGGLYALDAKTGVQKWFLKSTGTLDGKTVKNVVSSPAIVDSTLYFVNDEGYFFALR